MIKAHMTMLAAESRKLEQAGLYRAETIHAAHLVDFTSQDYLGLTNDPRLVSAAKAALETHGLGETHPIAPNGSPGGRQKNRRVEFVILGESHR